MEPDAVEIRVLGCLIEKQRTTPDVYPLTLNSLRLACNQSTNRDPVVDYDDGTVRAGLDRLVQRKWTTLASWSNRRAMKYRHTLDTALGLDDAEVAVLCVLMLRGPQTPGELRSRTERLHRFADSGELHDALDRLIGRELAERLGRRPGQREERYRQLLGDLEAEAAAEAAPPEEPVEPVEAQAPVEAAALVGAASPPTELAAPAPDRAPVPHDGLAARVERLERELAELREGLDALREELGA
jgi:uncharacterized protein YceH (UPF0502 family)